MPRLKIATYIKEKPERVFERVTSFGKNGVLEKESFEEKCGRIERQEKSVVFTNEMASESKEATVNWKCSFEYPNMRMMEAPGTMWADRKDTFVAWDNGTRWTVEWTTRIGGFRGFIQSLYFRLRGKRKYHENVVKPVLEHFKS